MFVFSMRSLSLATAAGALLLCAGCSGPQNTDNAVDGCQTYDASMSASALSSAVLCHAATPSDDSVALCRAALGRAGSLTEEALTAAAPCLLNAQDRADGAIVAEAFLGVHDTESKVIALANALSPSFDESVHGNTFAVALSRDAQRGLGEALGGLNDTARDLIVATALTFNLDPLSGYCTPYIQDIPSTDPILVNYAAGINQQQPLNSTELWVLAATGEWDGNDVFECINGEAAGCNDSEGTGLELLAAVTDAGGPSAPSQALDQLRLGDITPEEAAAITTFLTTNSYPNRGNYINTILGLMTNIERPLPIRTAIATSATSMMCNWDTARVFARNAQTSDPDPNAETSAWRHFVEQCNTSIWTAEDLAGALAQGSWLHVPHSVVADVNARLTVLTEGWTCDQYLSLADVAYSRRDVVFMAGQGVVSVANVAGDACAGQFTERITAISDDTDGHPEGRLAAIGWLLDHGDSSGCSNISAAMRWYHADLHVGATEWAEEMQAELEPRCN